MVASIFLGWIGVNEILIIALVLLLLFGGKKIPELMKGLGSGIKEFKKASQDNPEAVSKETKEESTETKKGV